MIVFDIADVKYQNSVTDMTIDRLNNQIVLAAVFILRSLKCISYIFETLLPNSIKKCQQISVIFSLIQSKAECVMPMNLETHP